MSIFGLGITMRAGTMHNQMKMNELSQKFERRKQNLAEKRGTAVEPTKKERDIARMQEQMKQIREGNKTGQLDIKLKSGAELTNEELEYLKTNNPELYQKAIEVKKERAAYKKQLENCQTKEDVEKLRANKLQSFTAEIKTIRSNPNIGEGKKLELIDQVGRRFMGIMNEHNKFVRTTKYKELPSEEERAEGCKKKTEQQDSSDLEQELRLLLAASGAPAEPPKVAEAVTKAAVEAMSAPPASGGQAVEATRLDIKA